MDSERAEALYNNNNNNNNNNNTENYHIGHCTHTSESVNVKYNRANAGTGDIGTINSNDRIATTMCSLGTWFVSGIYVQIPCRKEPK
jgi:hypothetical protein